MRVLMLSVLLVACGSESKSNPPSVDAGPDAMLEPKLEFFSRPTLDGAETKTTKSFWADVVIVRASGFLPHAHVTLRAASTLRDGLYTSWATFETSDKGDIDTMSDAPIDGTYTGVDVDGVTWSMTKTTDAPDAPIAQWALRIDAEVDGNRVARSTLDRYYVSESATRVPVSEGGLVGVYYAPNDGKKHPTILAFGGSEGGISGGESSAAYWSSLGYSALGVAYFGADGLPANLAKIPLEYFDSAMKWLDTRADADATRLAVVGGSRGGELALLLSATYPRIKGTVAHAPSGVLWGGFGDTGTEVASWTFGGADLPWVPFPPGVFAGTTRDPVDNKLLYVSTPTFEKALAAATPAQIDAATSRVEKSTGPILMFSGADDQLWPSCKLAEYAMARLRAAGHDKAEADESLCFEGTGHFIPTPGGPTIGAHRVFHPVSKVWYLLGGEPQKTARAARTSDAKQRAFMKRVLGE